MHEEMVVLSVSLSSTSSVMAFTNAISHATSKFSPALVNFAAWIIIRVDTPSVRPVPFKLRDFEAIFTRGSAILVGTDASAHTTSRSISKEGYVKSKAQNLCFVDSFKSLTTFWYPGL